MPTLDSGLGRGSRRWRLLAWVGAALAVAAFAGWYVTHPEPLPPAHDQVVEATRSGRPVYVGVLPPGHQLTVRAWSFELEGAVGTLLVCRDGGIGTSTDLATFCSGVQPADGAHLGSEDSLVLQVLPDAPGTVTGGPLHLSWRSGVQFGDQLTGPSVEITALD